MQRNPHEEAAAPGSPLPISEAKLLFLVSAVQFVNILDFMIVMPLGPDFAADLGIAVSHLGIIGGSYTASAAVSGLIASRFLDRFDRRSALACAMFGLVVGTALGGLSEGLASLILARVVAGAFGGPATALALSIVADAVPPARRGRALGIVMGSFSAASVLGVPAGLELARLGGWRTPFFAVAALAVVVATAALVAMPSMRLHLQRTGPRPPKRPLSVFLSDGPVLPSLLASFSVMMASFCIIPNVSTYLQHNLGYPRDGLGRLYLVGGIFSFVSMRFIGAYVDRIGGPRVALFGTVLFAAVVTFTFIAPQPGVPVMLLFVAFMSTMGFRAVPLSALSSRVPAPHERARFMSLQSGSQHIASACGAVLSSALLGELPDHRLTGMVEVSIIAIVLSCALPLLLAMVERRVKEREAARAAIEAEPATVPA